MSTTADPSWFDNAMQSLRRAQIRREPQGKWLGGVATGVARRLDVDPVLIRVAVILLSLFFGVGAAAYLLAWALLPDVDGVIHLERAVRQQEKSSVILCIVALLSTFGVGQAGQNNGGGGLALLAVLAAGAYIIGHNRRPTGTTPEGRGAAAPTPTSAAGTPSASATSPTIPPYTPPPTAPAEAASSPGSPTTPLPPPLPRPAHGNEPSAHSSGPPLGAPPWAATTPPGASAPPAPAPSSTDVSTHEAPASSRRKTGGVPAFLLAAGLAIVAFQTVRTLIGDPPGRDSVYPVAAALAAVALVLAGLGLKGLRGGGVTVLAVLLSVSVLTSSAGSGIATDMGERTWKPGPNQPLQSSYQLGMGAATLDLTTTPTNSRSDVSVNVGLGEITVLLPQGQPYRIVPQVGMGEVVWVDDAGDTHTSSGVGRSPDDIVFPAAPGVTTPETTIRTQVGMGTLTIERR